LFAPVLAVALYPRAKWLFAFVLLGTALLFNLLISKRHDTKPQEVADRAERLLTGTSWGWDVDDYEHLNPRDPQVRELWRRSMAVGGLPEKWPQLDEDKKNQLLGIIREVRQLGTGS